MRMFVAVFPPPAVQAAAHAMGAALREAGDGVSWVKPANLHYTMRFLGEVGADGAGRVAEAAREAAARVPAFDAALGTAGAFPDPKRARVLWIGMERGGESLARLAAALDAALARRGFAPEGRGFSAHLTIGRVREPRRDWTDALARVRPGPGAGFRVERLAVVESRLHPAGSIYTVVEAAPLAAG